MIADTKEYHLGDHHLLSQKKALGAFKTFKRYLFGCLIDIFEPEFNTSISFNQQLIREVTTAIIILIQSVSLFWYPDMPLRHWSSYSTFWNCLRFFNYDYLSARLNVYPFCILVEFILFIYSLITVALYCIFKHFNYEMPSSLLYVAKIIIVFLTSILLIPFLTTLLVVLKYSTGKYDYVHEYDDYDTNSYNFGALGSTFSFLILAAFLPISFLVEIIKADLRHSVAYKNLKARSNSVWDLLCRLCFVIQCSLFVFLDKNLHEYHLVISMTMGAYLLVLEFRYLHYFNPIENSIQACKMGCISICSVVFLFSYLTDSATTLTLLCIFLPPLSCFFITFYIHKKYWALKFNRDDPKNQYTLERSIRHILTDKNCKNKTEINELLSKHFNSTMKKNALYTIWEVNFCINIAKDERLGRVKLTKCHFLKPNIEAYVQKFRIFRKFEKNEISLPEIEYLDHLLSLDEAKKSDEEICSLLLDLWAEIVRKDPSINKLRNFITKIYDLSNEIKKLYGSISQEIKNSEVFDLYGLFLINILGEIEEGNTILKRKLNIKSESYMDFKKLENYDEKFGIMLISTDINTFGTIAYMNEKAAIILKVSPTEMIGHDFNQFIPKPYSLNHNDYMLNYYKSCTSTVLEESHASFLQNRNGYLFECNALIKLTAFKNKAYFIISFTQCTQMRQIILISEEGQIFSHSSQLMSLIGLEKTNYRNMNISDLIPGVSLSNLPLYEPFIIYHNNRKLALVHTVRNAKLTPVHLILILADYSEIEKWKNQKSDEQLAYFLKLPKIIKESPDNEYKDEMLMRTKTKKLAFNINSIEKTSYISSTYDVPNSEVADEEKSYSAAPVSSAYSQSISCDRSASKYIVNTGNAIKKFQWVLFVAIIAMIGTNIGILIYIIKEVRHANSLETFNRLGQIMFYIGSTANIVRSIDIEISQGIYNLTRDSEYYSKNIAVLSSLQQSVLDDKSQWSYCPSSKIVEENLIPIWEFDMGEPYLKKHNLYDTIALFIKHGQSLLKYSKTKEESYIYESKWLIINSISYSFDLVNSALSGLVECEKNRIYDSSLSIALLQWTGVTIICLCLAVLVYFIIELKIAYENFWKFIKKSVNLSYFALRQVAFDRLISIHGADLNQENETPLKYSKSSSDHIKTTLTWKFSWRLSFFGILSFSFYLLIMFYLYEDCRTYMINRPKLLQNFNLRRTLLARIGYFTRDINLPTNKNLYQQSYSLSDPSIEFEKSILWYREEYSSLRSKELHDLLSISVRQRIFEETVASFDFMKYGTGAASYSVIFDAFYFGVNEYRSPTEKDYFITSFTTLQDSMSKSFDMIDSSSKEAISLQLSIIIDITIAFSVGLILIYLLYYLPFVKAQTIYLEKARILPKMIPEVGNEKLSEIQSLASLISVNDRN
ncbi:unnamed protein product [Blepharisma stoltei]|uniref:TmcB/TmcC TPR repeats domain-containing protein n=1 Tax=Blepharisma stoltei TaxID=1481888 RepID=A0AAU9JP18_9CILI|nr:unnamed protein product [Blepharisma stoltei]